MTDATLTADAAVDGEKQEAKTFNLDSFIKENLSGEIKLRQSKGDNRDEAVIAPVAIKHITSQFRSAAKMTAVTVRIWQVVIGVPAGLGILGVAVNVVTNGAVHAASFFFSAVASGICARLCYDVGKIRTSSLAIVAAIDSAKPVRSDDADNEVVYTTAQKLLNFSHKYKKFNAGD